MNSRELHNIIAIGTIAAISDDGLTVQVTLGGVTTKFIHLTAISAPGFRFTSMLRLF